MSYAGPVKIKAEAQKYLLARCQGKPSLQYQLAPLQDV